mgnify:CR=1 FL=1
MQPQPQPQHPPPRKPWWTICLVVGAFLVGMNVNVHLATLGKRSIMGEELTRKTSAIRNHTNTTIHVEGTATDKDKELEASDNKDEINRPFLLPMTADPKVSSLFAGLCRAGSGAAPAAGRNNNTNNDPTGISSLSSACLVQTVQPDAATLAHIRHNQDQRHGCLPFREGRVLHLPWCAWDSRTDGHISGPILRREFPEMEKEPLGIFQTHLQNKPPGIVIDAGSQVGLFSAVALAAGHYTVSVDARPEHIQMNMVSRALNGYYDTPTTSPQSSKIPQQHKQHGMIVHGALADSCSGVEWATMPHAQQEHGNPGASNIVGRVNQGWPHYKSLEEFQHLFPIPMVTLDAIMEKVFQQLASMEAQPQNTKNSTRIRPHVYALKMDIEGFEPRALMGATRLFSYVQPDLIILEVFVHRFADCNVKVLLQALLALGYRMDVSPRLNVQCPTSSCKDMRLDSPAFATFVNGLGPQAEMDLVFYRI